MSLLALALTGCPDDPAATPEPEATGSDTDAPPGTTASPGETDAVDSTSTGDASTDDASPDDTTGSGTDGDTTTGDPTGIEVTVEELWRVSSTSGSVEAVCVHADGDVVMVGASAPTRPPVVGYVQAVSADGELQWRTDLPDEGALLFFYDVACAPDGSVYAAGLSGDDYPTATPHMVRLDGATGDVIFSLKIVGTDREGAFFGVAADEGGAYGVGARDATAMATEVSSYVTHIFADGTEDWSYTYVPGEVHDVVLRNDTLRIAGWSDVGFIGGGLVVLDLEGTPVGNFELGLGLRATHLAEDPDASQQWVVGRVDDTSWSAWSCDDASCSARGVPLPELDRLDGVALDGSGNLLTLRDGELGAYASDGSLQWTHDTSLAHPIVLERSALAVDDAGAILVGGEQDDQPTLVKLAVTVQ